MSCLIHLNLRLIPKASEIYISILILLHFTNFLLKRKLYPVNSPKLPLLPSQVLKTVIVPVKILSSPLNFTSSVFILQKYTHNHKISEIHNQHWTKNTAVTVTLFFVSSSKQQGLWLPSEVSTWAAWAAQNQSVFTMQKRPNLPEHRGLHYNSKRKE